jgi:hypothetical protein
VSGCYKFLIRNVIVALTSYPKLAVSYSFSVHRRLLKLTSLATRRGRPSF